MEYSNQTLLLLLESWLKSIPIEEKNTEECVAYMQEVAKAVQKLEELLSGKPEPMQMAMDCLKTTCEFYQGDWCGILDVEEDVSVWTPFWWYDAAADGMSESRYERFESTSPYPRWVKALHENKSVVVTNVEMVQEECPTEYEQLKKQQLLSVIGAPYQRRTTGFLIVKNPKRFLTYTSPLHDMAYLIAAEIDDYKVADSATVLLAPDLTVDADVSIELFGGLKIQAERGTLCEDEMQAPKVCRILAYLVLNSYRSVTAHEAIHKIWPDEGINNPNDRMKNFVYRLRQIFKTISDKELVVSTRSGYRLNPELHIVTDVGHFEQLRQSAPLLRDKKMEMQFLKKALKVYKGNLLPLAMPEHWLVQYASYYNGKYLSVAKRLFKLLAEDGDFETIERYSGEALKIERGNTDLYYWSILALNKNGSAVMARKQLIAASEALLPEEYQTLMERLDKTAPA